MLRAALTLALTLATAATAAQSLGAPHELEPAADAVLVHLDADARAQLDALCDELIGSLEPKNSRQGVSGKFAARIRARAPSSAERTCEIFAVEGGVVVVAGKYAFAAFDPINNWDPFGLAAAPACPGAQLSCRGATMNSAGEIGEAGKDVVTGQWTPVANPGGQTLVTTATPGPATLIPAATASGLSTWELLKLSVLIGIGAYQSDVFDPSTGHPGVSEPTSGPPITDPIPAGGQIQLAPRPPALPPGMTRQELGDFLKWPTPKNPGGGPAPTPEQLKEKGISKEDLEKWKKFYEEIGQDPKKKNNPSADPRVPYLDNIIKQLSGGGGKLAGPVPGGRPPLPNPGLGGAAAIPLPGRSGSGLPRSECHKSLVGCH